MSVFVNCTSQIILLHLNRKLYFSDYFVACKLYFSDYFAQSVQCARPVGGCPEVGRAYFSQFCLEARPEPYFKPPTALNTMFGLSLERLGHSGMGAIIESETFAKRQAINDRLWKQSTIWSTRVIVIWSLRVWAD